MANQVSGDTWGERLTLRIGERIRSARLARGLSVRDLALRTQNLGQPVSRQSLVNLESGRRSSVGVEELFIIAHALGVNPLFLIHDPVNQGARVEVVPELWVTQWQAMEWVSSRPGLISSTLYGDDFDDGRGILWMRSNLDQVRSEIRNQENRIAYMQENKIDIQGVHLSTEIVTDEEVERSVRSIQELLKSMREREMTLVSALEMNEVQMNEKWFNPRAVTYYRERIYDEIDTDTSGPESPTDV
jgi:transcriptional regulator with XRE-family HTH domain